MNKISPAVAFLAKCAVLCSVLLLLANLRESSARTHAWLIAVPLTLVGVAYAVLQVRLRPGRRILAQRLVLAAAFILWAIDQFLSGWLATLINDVVVSAYVLDLFWIIREQRESPGS